MATAQDTEITLGTGRMLAIFFGFVLVCAFFFSIGFSLGRRTTIASASNWPGAVATSPATVVRPSAAKSDAAQTAPQPQANDFSFYKAVGEKTANSGLTPEDATTQTAPAAVSTTPVAAVTTADAPANTTTGAASVPPSGGGYFVQVAAVSRQEDADSLVEALKKKQYPAFTVNNTSADKFFHVQVGPYGDVKDAEAMRTRLIGDGYNPIVKR
jgi:DedD protein